MDSFEQKELSLMEIFDAIEQMKGNVKGLSHEEQVALQELHTKQQAFLEHALSDKEKYIHNIYLKGVTYEETMNELGLNNPKMIDNAICRVKRKIEKMKRLEEKKESILYAIQQLQQHFLDDVLVHPPLSQEEIAHFTAFHGITIPMEYEWLLSKVGNGFKVFDVELYSLYQTFSTKKLKKGKPFKFFVHPQDNNLYIAPHDVYHGLYIVEQTAPKTFDDEIDFLHQLNRFLKRMLEENLSKKNNG